MKLFIIQYVVTLLVTMSFFWSDVVDDPGIGLVLAIGLLILQSVIWIVLGAKPSSTRQVRIDPEKVDYSQRVRNARELERIVRSADKYPRGPSRPNVVELPPTIPGGSTMFYVEGDTENFKHRSSAENRADLLHAIEKHRDTPEDIGGGILTDLHKRG